MKPAQPNPVVSFLRRIPTPIALAIGVILGLCVSQLWSSSRSAQNYPTWDGGASLKSQRPHRLNSFQPTVPPTPEQRLRILNLLSTLSPHHTRTCTRNSQPGYVKQVEERYTPLVGHSKPNSRSWWSGHEEEHASSTRRRSELSALGHKYFFAINLYNSFDVIPDLFATMFRVGAVLGYQNVFVSIYENGSSDQTKALLRIFDSLTRSVGMRVVIRTSMRRRGAFNHRIEYLAEVRNAAMVPLHELRENEGEVFDSVVFMNDVLPCIDDVLELIWQSRRQNAGLTCAADYMFHDGVGAPVFYDNWVARDINGTALENAPFEQVFHHPESSDRFQRHLPIQVQSCWNGIAVLDPAPLYATPHKVWDIIHPLRRNLTAIRGYVRLGGLPDDPRTDPQDRSWYGPHDRLFVPEESQLLDFVPGPPYVWCWGWDGAGDLDGPDVD
ncbi:unnamed protein product, partial [Rhizoctonia solani]